MTRQTSSGDGFGRYSGNLLFSATSSMSKLHTQQAISSQILPLLRPTQIVGSVVVAMLACGLSSLLGIGCQSANQSNVYPALHVDVSGDGLQVGRVDAAMNTAKVVYFEALWDRANKGFIRQSVCKPLKAPPIFRNAYSAVSASVFLARPQPAAIFVFKNLSFYTFGHQVSGPTKHGTYCITWREVRA